MRSKWRLHLSSVRLVAGSFMIGTLIIAGCKHPQKKFVVSPAPRGWVKWSESNRLSTLAATCAANSDLVNRVSTSKTGVQIQSELEQRFKGFKEDSLPFSFRPKGAVGARSVAKLNNGFLIGFNGGEWGGTLWRVDDTGNQSTMLLDENVVTFAQISGRVYVFTDMFGKGFKGGGIYRISKEGEITERTDLDAAPVAFDVDRNSSLLVLARDAVYRLSLDLRSKEKLSQTALYRFVPNSLATAPDGSIFAGMNFYVLRLVPAENNYQEEWLVRNECRFFHVDTEKRECVCDGP